MPEIKNTPPAQPKRSAAPRAKASKAPQSLPDFGSSIMVPRKTRDYNQFMRGFIVIVLAVLIIAAGYLIVDGMQKAAREKTKTSQNFYAVFLNTGQVYFGNITHEDRDNLVLDNVFYVQVVNEQVPAEKEGEQPKTVQKTELVKKGDEAYGPSSSVRINRSQVSVIEQLRADSKVLKDIQARLKK